MTMHSNVILFLANDTFTTLSKMLVSSLVEYVNVAL